MEDLQVSVVVLAEQLQEAEDGQHHQDFGRQLRFFGLFAFQSLLGQHVLQRGADDAQRQRRFITTCIHSPIRRS